MCQDARAGVTAVDGAGGLNDRPVSWTAVTLGAPRDTTGRPCPQRGDGADRLAPPPHYAPLPPFGTPRISAARARSAGRCRKGTNLTATPSRGNHAQIKGVAHPVEDRAVARGRRAAFGSRPARWKATSLMPREVLSGGASATGSGFSEGPRTPPSGS